MTEALFVLNPRHIPNCVRAIQKLDIPKCWLSYMNEQTAAGWINEIARSTSFDRYLILSDDTTPTQHALDLVLSLADVGHPVVTGYCNLDENGYRDIVNLTTNPLPTPPADSRSYHLMTRKQVEQHPNAAVPTTFAGLALTLLDRDTLLTHPLQVEPTTGGQMDYDLSYRLAQAGIPIVAANGAYVHHVKERWSHMDQNPEKRLLIGERKPLATWTNLIETPA